MPDWLRDRRDEVVERLSKHSEHVLQEDAHGYSRNGAQLRWLRADHG